MGPSARRSLSSPTSSPLRSCTPAGSSMLRPRDSACAGVQEAERVSQAAAWGVVEPIVPQTRVRLQVDIAEGEDEKDSRVVGEARRSVEVGAAGWAAAKEEMAAEMLDATTDVVANVAEDDMEEGRRNQAQSVTMELGAVPNPDAEDSALKTTKAPARSDAQRSITFAVAKDWLATSEQAASDGGRP